MNKLPEKLEFDQDIFFDKKDIIKLIETAADWMDKNPDFQPKFSMVANILLNDNDETRDMTQEIYKLSGIESDQGSLMPDMLFYHYAVAVTTINKEGFDKYVELELAAK